MTDLTIDRVFDRATLVPSGIVPGWPSRPQRVRSSWGGLAAWAALGRSRMQRDGIMSSHRSARLAGRCPPPRRRVA